MHEHNDSSNSIITFITALTVLLIEVPCWCPQAKFNHLNLLHSLEAKQMRVYL